MKLVPRILIQTCCSPIGLAKKLVQDFFFPYDVSSSSYLSLTSFKTILLDCVVTAVISVCIFKNLSKLVSFCVTLILKMEENMQHFQHIMLSYFKKFKNTTETHTKRFAQCME